MKKLSDYTGSEAIEIWGKLLVPISDIVVAIQKDAKIKEEMTLKNGSQLELISKLMVHFSKEITTILLLVDDTPIDAINMLPRTISIFGEMMKNPSIASFLALVPQEKTENEFTGSVTENTEEGTN